MKYLNKHLTKEERYSEWEWSGMPSFFQEKQEPYKILVVKFDSEEDLEKFSKKVDQKLTVKTQSAWYPYKSHHRESQLIWVDDNE
jgi:hypothetical protein